MKTLSKEQIDALFDFTRKHYVEYYDLQVELVDHLANDIEQIMNENPKISFEQARDKAFKKFGITGFSDVVSAKTWQMQKEYYKLIFKHFLSLLTSKIIIISIAFFAALSYIFRYSKYNIYFFTGIIIILTVVATYLMFVNNRRMGKRIKNKDKVLLVESVSASLGNPLVYFNLLFNLLSFVFRQKSDNESSELIANYSVIFGLLLVVSVLFWYVATQNASIEIRKKYRKKYFVQ